ncbi:hypothetical protein Tco_0608284 [Tanacetum coccineum]
MIELPLTRPTEDGTTSEDILVVIPGWFLRLDKCSLVRTPHKSRKKRATLLKNTRKEGWMSLGEILLCITGEILAVMCAGRWVLVNGSKCAKGRKPDMANKKAAGERNCGSSGLSKSCGQGQAFLSVQAAAMPEDQQQKTGYEAKKLSF